MNPIEKTLEHDWRPFLSKLATVELLNDILKTILGIMLSSKYVLCGPLLTLLPAFRPALISKVQHVYAEVMN